MDERDLKVIQFVAERGEVPLRELEDWIASTWRISIDAAWRIVRRLVKRRVLRYRRHARRIYVELHPEFVALITHIYSLVFSRQPHRVRYQETKHSIP